MRKAATSNNNICLFTLFYKTHKDLNLVFISTTTKYNYLGFLIAIDTHLNILYSKSLYVFSNNDFTFIKDYNFLLLNGNKIVSVTPIKISNSVF